MKNLKSLLAFFLACMMVVSCFVITPVFAGDEEWSVWGGSEDLDDSWKTKGDDGFYHITSAAQLASFAATINADTTANHRLYQGETVVLDVNIRLNDTTKILKDEETGKYKVKEWAEDDKIKKNPWTPIGNYPSKYQVFSGTFDGNGHTIEGMYCTTGARTALFGAIDECTVIKNLTVTKSYSSGSGNGIGIIAGQMANPNDVTTDAKVFQNITVTDSYVKNAGGGGCGAILGRTAGLGGQTLTFYDCDVQNTTVEAGSFAGAVFGYHGSGSLGALVFDECHALDNTIKATASSGGLMGGSLTLSANNTTEVKFNKCEVSSTLEIDEKGNNNGGLVGYFGSAPQKIIIQNTDVGGTVHTFQNSAHLIGRLGSGAATKDISIKVLNSSSSVELLSDTDPYPDGSTTYYGNCNGIIFGLFQAASGTTIKEIIVEGFTTSGKIDAKKSEGGTIGMLGSIGTSIATVSIKDVISSTDMIGAAYVGGILATTQYKITNLTFDNVYISGDITSTGTDVGGFIGSYRANGGGNWTIKNSVYNGNIVANDVAGGIMGRSAHGNLNLKIENVAALGSIETKSTSVAGGEIGALIGRYGFYQVAQDTVSINNFYYNMDFVTAYTGDMLNNSAEDTTYDGNGRLGSFYGADTDGTNDGKCATYDGDTNILDGYTFYTPFNDTTNDFPGAVYTTDVAGNPSVVSNTIEKQPNITIVNFLEATKGLSFGIEKIEEIEGEEHTCVPVEMEQESAAVSRDDAVKMMTLGCEMPGCENHKITSTIGDWFLIGYRDNSDGYTAGLRFGFRMDSALNGLGTENDINMGVVMIPTDLIPEDEELTVKTTNALIVPAERRFPEENTEKYVAGAETFTGLLVNIPSEQYDRQISARGYVEINGTYYYTTVGTASFNSVKALDTEN